MLWLLFDWVLWYFRNSSVIVMQILKQKKEETLGYHFQFFEVT